MIIDCDRCTMRDLACDDCVVTFLCERDTDDAVVTFERSTRTAVRGEPLSWVDGITAERSRRYGETTLWYGRRS